MAQGISGQIESGNGAYANGFYFKTRCSYSETYEVSTNTSTLSFNTFQVHIKPYASRPGVWHISGTLYVNGTSVVSVTDGQFNMSSGQVAWYTFPASGSINVPHNTDGTKSVTITGKFVLAKIEIGSVGSWLGDYNKTLTLTTIARQSVIDSAANKTLGEACDIRWTPAVSSYYYRLKFSIGSFSATTGVISPNRNTQYTYTGYTLPLDIANQVKNSTTGTVTATLYTYSNSAGTTQVGNASSKSFTVTLPSTIKPSVSNVTSSIVNTNSTINGWGVAVAGYTKVRLTANSSGAYGSTVSSFSISGAASKTVSGTSLDWTSDVITSSGSKQFTVTCSDSRGRTSAGATTSAITFYSYSNPSITAFTAGRGSVSTNITVKADWTYSSVNNKNNSSAILKYRKTTESGWTNYGNIAKATTVNLNKVFDETSSYVLRLEVTDSLGNVATREATVSTIDVLLDFRAGGNGLGIGKICESDALEVDLPAKFFNTLSMENHRISNVATPTAGNDAVNKSYVDGHFTSSSASGTFSSSYTWSNYSTLTLQKFGNVVVAVLCAYKTSAGVAASTTFATVPVGFRPISNAASLFDNTLYGNTESAASSVYGVGNITIRTDGSVVQTVGSGKIFTCYASFVYFVA